MWRCGTFLKKEHVMIGEQMNKNYWKGKVHPNWRSIEKQCKYCGDTFSSQPSKIKRGNGVFCCPRCFYDYNIATGRFKGKNNHNWNRIERKCRNCGKDFFAKSSTIKKGNGFLCSNQCRKEYITGENNPFWKGGKSFEPYGFEFNKKLKQDIMQRDNCFCQMCKELIWNGHAIHHIDYNKKNNDPFNLILLCAKCHGITVTNRFYWEGYFINYQLEKGLKP